MIQKAEYLHLKKPFIIIRRFREFVQIMHIKHFKNIFEEFHDLKVDISKRLESTFKVIPKRWKVECTFS